MTYKNATSSLQEHPLSKTTGKITSLQNGSCNRNYSTSLLEILSISGLAVRNIKTMLKNISKNLNNKPLISQKIGVGCWRGRC